jgi:hypothetical protein
MDAAAPGEAYARYLAMLRESERRPPRELARRQSNATPILIAPYPSAEAQALCREHEIGFLDLEGNSRLVWCERPLVPEWLDVFHRPRRRMISCPSNAAGCFEGSAQRR